MLNQLCELSSSFTHLTPELTANEFVWSWLANLIGDTAAQTVQILVMVLVYGLVLYLDGVQVIRLMNNFANRNSENGNQRAEARESIKQSFFIIACVTIIGGVGFTAICFFINKIIPAPVT